MKEILGIGIGGFFGSIARYLLSGWISRYTTLSFPFGTLAVNMVGSFILGLIMALSLRTLLVSDTLRIVVGVGFLGALTTFSTFSYETMRLIGERSWYLAVWNIGLNLFGCLVATAIAFGFVHWITGE